MIFVTRLEQRSMAYQMDLSMTANVEHAMTYSTWFYRRLDLFSQAWHIAHCGMKQRLTAECFGRRTYGSR